MFEGNILVREIFFTYNGLIMRTGQSAKRVANKTNGLVDKMLLSLTPKRQKLDAEQTIETLKKSLCEEAIASAQQSGPTKRTRSCR